MDMNEFEGNSELGPVRSSHEANAGESAAPEMKDALHDEIRALRRQLERLQAFQPARHPEQEESPEELPDEEADIDQPDNSALAKPPRRWSPSRRLASSMWRPSPPSDRRRRRTTSPNATHSATPSSS